MWDLIVSVPDHCLSFYSDVTAKTPDNNTALHICCKYGHRGCVEYLLHSEKSFYGILLKDSFNDQALIPLLVALYTNHNSEKETTYMEIVKFLIYLQACEVNKCSDERGSPLHVAARKWNTAEVIKVLTDAGTDVNAVVSVKTPLKEALSTGKANNINWCWSIC